MDLSDTDMSVCPSPIVSPILKDVTLGNQGMASSFRHGTDIRGGKSDSSQQSLEKVQSPFHHFHDTMLHGSPCACLQCEQEEGVL